MQRSAPQPETRKTPAGGTVVMISVSKMNGRKLAHTQDGDEDQ